MKLYNFFRSGTSHRLRIVLNLKGLDWDYVAVDLRAEAHFDAAFPSLEPVWLATSAGEDQVLLLTREALLRPRAVAAQTGS